MKIERVRRIANGNSSHTESRNHGGSYRTTTFREG